MEGDWWGQLLSPVRGRSAGAQWLMGGVRSARRASPHLLYLGLLLITGSWLVFQFSFVPAFSRDRLPPGVARQLLFNHPEILHQTQRAGAPGVGYLAAELPEAILEVLQDDDTNLPEQPAPPAPAAPETSGESDFAPERLSPILRGRTGAQVVAALPTARAALDSADEFALVWEYGAETKLIPYVGNAEFVSQFDRQTERRAYLNSLAVFPLASNSDFVRMHGRLGVHMNGTAAWIPDAMPPPIAETNATEALRRGGFYLALANALPLDRAVEDNRQSVCRREGWDYHKMGDASIVVTFYNEPLSTLLRTVHSVLNNTPPPLLREIILVDDHSALPELQPGGELYDYVALLPKTKVLRLPERRGLVWARLAGAQAAQGETLVVLDSHVETNPGWLEPQLERLRESPKSVVFPQILALEPRDFSYKADRGIGCWLSWKWNMVEQASLTGELTSEAPIASPSMAGGLFAVRLEWFWEVGGYDEGFAMWGSENVEMGFRVWMCGGRLECTPCALTYHIYRDGGTGYSSPDQSVHTNKLRTARLWMDDHFLIAREFLARDAAPLGDVEPILRLKQRLHCKSFRWFLDHVDPTHEVQHLEDVEFFGEVRSRARFALCLDSLSHSEDQPFGTYTCHRRGGTQRWLKDRHHTRIRSASNDSLCLGAAVAGPPAVHLVHCSDAARADRWTYHNDTASFRYDLPGREPLCLTALDLPEQIELRPCQPELPEQQWEFDPWIPPPFEPLAPF